MKYINKKTPTPTDEELRHSWSKKRRYYKKFYKRLWKALYRSGILTKSMTSTKDCCWDNEWDRGGGYTLKILICTGPDYFGEYDAYDILTTARNFIYYDYEGIDSRISDLQLLKAIEKTKGRYHGASKGCCAKK